MTRAEIEALAVSLRMEARFSNQRMLNDGVLNYELQDDDRKPIIRFVLREGEAR